MTDSRKPDMNTHKIKHELQSLVQSYIDGETCKEASTWYTQGAYTQVKLNRQTNFGRSTVTVLYAAISSCVLGF